ncbi:ferritin-like domain-containing protein [Delftia tsuruhatensis]|nr:MULTISPECIES: ferritin-like domain-containing protein [Delftia]MDH2233337.1 ferritin-like domain-containing protein [Delftia tsuruhatensis]WFF79088.1 ferritin-like domain-containing protein [Delftia tsuruhatensis]SDZ58489.1 P-aminobenzoate N-oxygenase AurF [Delftia lacustris]
MPDSDSGALPASTQPASTLPVIDLQGLGFDAGAHLLVKHALAALPVGGQLRVTGSAPGWQAQLSGWCSDQGHGLRWEDGVDAAQAMAIVARGGAQAGRWRGAAQTGRSDARSGDGAVAAQAQPFWGLAARGAQVEAGAPAFHFRLSDKLQVWTDSASDLYAQAVAAQWNADTDIDWNDAPELPAPVEDAIVQLMTYMVENENAALLVPARFLGQLHPHYRELQAALAIQVADEARHIDVFTRRIRRHGREPALSTAGGQASLKSLLDETDFSVAGFLLSVLGEGTFVHLLQFLQTEAPDPLTRQICRLAARDEARHVALGMSHLLYRLQHEPGFQHQLAQAVEQRFDNLAGTSGLNEEVFDALILIAAGTLTPEALARGAARVQQLMRDMADGRFSKLLRLGFERGHAERLASLHTRNFM